ncbi:MAG: DAK2 domain-containing protein [Clostridiales bacterium]|nr:DAK2 domain-containing protein [Clostridiales bacterium]
MGTISVDGNLLKKMIIAGANALTKKRHEVDAMNVFPVPDGDTGTNMSMTVLAAAREVDKLNTPNIYDVAKAASGGSLRGARGNSGVILSQLFRGFAKGLEGVDIAGTANAAISFRKATETAYKAVMKPKEGTILTIARAFGEKADELAKETDDVEALLKASIEYAQEILQKTPQMLAELRQAGVVDAGGHGLLLFLSGALAIMNKPAEPLLEIGAATAAASEEKAFSAAAAASGEIKYGYCTEFFILVKNVAEEQESHFKSYLESVGDSIVAVADDELIKIHVHTDHPGQVLEKALKIGSLSNLKIENMRLQHTSMINFSSHSVEPESAKPFKEVGFVAVALGEGIKELFRNLGADDVIEGGQTMNSSAEDMIRAVEKVNSNVVYILPNNKNIILVAEQAAKMYTEKRIIVLPTKSIPQGITCLISYAQTLSVEENTMYMTEAMEQTHSGQITSAVRSTVNNGREITEGDFLGIIDGKIEIVSKTLEQSAKEMIDSMTSPGAEVISIYYGEDAKREDAEALAEYTKNTHSISEVEVLYGGQPIYYYIISAE